MPLICDEFVGVLKEDGAVGVRVTGFDLDAVIWLSPPDAVRLVMTLVGELARMGYIRMRMLWRICRAIDDANGREGA